MAIRGPIPPKGTTRGRGAFEDLNGAERRDYFGPPKRSWRTETVLASGINAVAGLWLLLSPWIVGFAGEDPVWSAVAAGGAVTSLALLRAGRAHRESGLSLINAAIGLWTLATAFWLYDTSGAAWNALIAGIAITLVALWSVAASEARPAAFRRDGDRGEGTH